MQSRYKVSVILLCILVFTTCAAAKEICSDCIKKPDEIHKKILEREMKRIKELKEIKKLEEDIASVTVSEYDYNFGGTQIYTPWLYISVWNIGRSDEISLKLKIPAGVNPVLSYSNCEVEYEVLDYVYPPILEVKFKDIPSCTDYVYADFRLEGLEKFAPFYPITNNPSITVNPSDFAPNSSGTVTVNVDTLNLDSTYDVWYKIKVYDVKNASVVSTSPPADYTYSYNSTDCYCGDCWSYAYAEWRYDDVSSISAHSTTFNVINDVNEVDIWIWIDIDKEGKTNIEVLDVSIPCDVWQYTDIDLEYHITLNPVSGDNYGFIKGKVYDKYGNPMSYVNVYAYQCPSCYCLDLYTYTNQNGEFSFKVPPGDWDVHAYSAGFETDWEYISVDKGKTTTIDLVGYDIPTAKITIKPIDDAMDTSVSYYITIENTFNEEIYVDLNDWTYVYIFNKSDCYWEEFESEDFDWAFSDNNFYLKPGESKTVIARLTYTGFEEIPDGKYYAEIPIDIEANDVWNFYYPKAYFFKGIDTEIYTDKYEYKVDDTMYLGLDVKNSDYAKNVRVTISLETPEGVEITLFQKQLIIPAKLNYSNPSFKVFTLPPITSGTYAWHIVISDPKTFEVLSEDYAEWKFARTTSETYSIADVFKIDTVKLQ